MDSTIKKRSDICKGCEKYTLTGFYFFTLSSCGEILVPEYDLNGTKVACGCLLKAKQKVELAECPQKLW